MDQGIGQLLVNNRRWSEDLRRSDPEFFPTLARQQKPSYLWIGCSDSRVPANEIIGLLPGEVFVHRNVANVVVHTDLNCLSVIQYAVEVLEIRDLIVCGHYGCGGVCAAHRQTRLGLIENWLRHIRDVEERYEQQLAAIEDHDRRIDLLCELNVVEQAVNVAETTVLANAWAAGRPVTVHGWIYGLSDGLIRDLGVQISSTDEIRSHRRDAVNAAVARALDAVGRPERQARVRV